MLTTLIRSLQSSTKGDEILDLIVVAGHLLQVDDHLSCNVVNHMVTVLYGCTGMYGGIYDSGEQLCTESACLA